MQSFSMRTINFFAFLFCCGLVGIGYYLQYGIGLQPCPLCQLQRFLFVLLALSLFFAVIHHPGILGYRIYSIINLILSSLGGVSALRQLWLQFHPAVGTPTCVPDLHYLITYLPWDQVLKFLFVGGSDCTKIEWTFLGLSLAAWSFICFLVLIIFSLAQLRLRTKS